MDPKLKPERPPGEDPAGTQREVIGGPYRLKRWQVILAIVTAPLTGWPGGDMRWRDFFIGLAIFATVVLVLLIGFWYLG